VSTVTIWIENHAVHVRREEGAVVTLVLNGSRVDAYNGPLPHRFVVQGRVAPAPEDATSLTMERRKDETIALVGWTYRRRSEEQS
jgi:hypothetical protein